MVFHRVPKNRQNAQRTVIPAMYRTCVFVGNALPRGGNSGWSFRRFWGRRDPQTATAGAGLKPAPAVGNYLKNDALPLILKLKVVNIHGVPVGDAHFLQAGEQTHLAELLVKIVP